MAAALAAPVLPPHPRATRAVAGQGRGAHDDVAPLLPAAGSRAGPSHGADVTEVGHDSGALLAERVRRSAGQGETVGTLIQVDGEDGCVLVESDHVVGIKHKRLFGILYGEKPPFIDKSDAHIHHAFDLLF